MFCPKCGKNIDEVSHYCRFCGEQIRVIQTEGKNSNSKAGNFGNMPDLDLPMRWYEFVINIQLFITAIYCFGKAGIWLSGSYYEPYATDELCKVYGMGLKYLDVFTCIIYFALVPAAIIVRNKMKNFKINAPIFYIGFMIVQSGIEIFYILCSFFITDRVLNVQGMMIGKILFLIVYIICNIIYFGKRRHMFINR